MKKHYSEKTFDEVINTLPKLKWEGREGWREEAKCRNMDTDLFFGMIVRNTAKTVCAECPVRLDCLEFALMNNIEYGLYGGMTAMERERMTVDDIHV